MRSGAVPRVAQVDRLEVRVLVDNSVDMLSTPGPAAEPELAGLVRRGMRLIAGRCLCCGAHGFACTVTSQRGAEKRTVLFDTGPDPLVLLGNAAKLGIDWGEIDAIVLSHGHFDHTGAVLAALDAIRNRKGGAKVPVYLHPDMFGRRGQALPDGTIVVLEDVPPPDLLREAGAEPIVTADATDLFDGLFRVSGEIARVTPFEVGLPGHLRRSDDEQGWEPDPLLMDERFLAVEVAGKGLVVFSACSHAGIVNVLHQARVDFPDTLLHGVVGGFHLVGSNEAIIPQTIEALKPFAPAVIAAGHCTGWRAQVALAEAFGQAVLAPAAAGKSYQFQAEGKYR
jgi:7,8-dihydropterin-6-yl-methyl-4-(beta-D-ribofuranosyl)aminobenzene 5'-phosphate synthase